MALTLHPRTEMRCVPALLARLSSGAPSTIVAVLVQLAVLPATVAAESPLTQETVAAYNAMAARVERRFVAAARRDTPAITSTLRHGEITVEPATGDGILKVPDGLVHHWRGTAFIRGVTLADVLRIARSYDEYSAIYDSVVASRLVAHHGNTYDTLMRIAKSEGPVAAVLDVHSTVTYETVTSRRAFSVSVADRIREIRNAGRRDERPLPSGHGRGYLWRAHVFSLFIANGEGVYVATETLGLSRRFPTLLAWAIEPVARHLGRNSVEGSLAALRAAVIARTERQAQSP